MITISDMAAEKAKEILSAEGKADWGLRVYMANNSCGGPSYGLDIDENPAEGDEVVEKNGLRVFMDKSTSQNLNGVEIDFVDDGERQGFVMTGGQSSCDTGCSSCG